MSPGGRKADKNRTGKNSRTKRTSDPSRGRIVSWTSELETRVVPGLNGAESDVPDTAWKVEQELIAKIHRDVGHL
jgi:hypothetical protein